VVNSNCVKLVVQRLIGVIWDAARGEAGDWEIVGPAELRETQIVGASARAIVGNHSPSRRYT
jgi:hypothetical protein